MHLYVGPWDEAQKAGQRRSCANDLVRTILHESVMAFAVGSAFMI
jgi:hypothetical protein